MSDNFNKDYGEYFKQLERQLENKNQPRATKKPAEYSANTRHKQKTKVKLNIPLIAFTFSLVLVIVIAIITVPKFSLKKGKIENKSNSAPVEEKQPEIKKPSFKEGELVAEIPADNDAKNAIVIDKQTDTIIAARNPHERAYPASTTKIMTLLVAVENITNFEETFTMSLAITDPLYIAEASVAGFLNNEVINMTDLLYGMILPSGADAAMALAIHISGSEAEFVKLMNQKVEELGLENTHFDNVTGLHSEQNYSSVYDMAIILDTALQNELCKKILSTVTYTTAKTPQNPNGIPLTSTLFAYMYGTEPETATIKGGKTGYVYESGYCIASYGTNNQNGNEYLIVTFGNTPRMPAFYGQIDLYKQFAK